MLIIWVISTGIAQISRVNLYFSLESVIFHTFTVAFTVTSGQIQAGRWMGTPEQEFVPGHSARSQLDGIWAGTAPWPSHLWHPELTLEEGAFPFHLYPKWQPHRSHLSSWTTTPAGEDEALGILLSSCYMLGAVLRVVHALFHLGCCQLLSSQLNDRTELKVLAKRFPYL